MDPRDRFDAWVRWLGISEAKVAERLNCHQTTVSKLRHKERGAGLALAMAIERETQHWPDGPIRLTEWAAARNGSNETVAATGTDGA